MPSSTSSSERGHAPLPPWRPPRLRGWAPLATSTAVFALSLTVWLVFLEPRLPPPLRRRPHPPGELSWYVDGTAALYLKGEARAEGWLAMGDSRVNHGLDEDLLTELGIEPLAVLWVGGGQLEDMLAAARDLPPRRLLVSLTPLAVHRVVTDAARERERALEVMDRSWSRRVDDAIDERFVRLRASVVDWIDSRAFTYAWLEAPSPGATDARQAGALAEPTRKDRAAALEAITRALRELRDSGREIVCVRMPISSSLRAVEDEAFDPALFERMCADLGLPYHDLGTSEPTVDGSHLTADGARHLAPRLADLLE